MKMQHTTVFSGKFVKIIILIIKWSYIISDVRVYHTALRENFKANLVPST